MYNSVQSEIAYVPSVVHECVFYLQEEGGSVLQNHCRLSSQILDALQQPRTFRLQQARGEARSVFFVTVPAAGTVSYLLRTASGASRGASETSSQKVLDEKSCQIGTAVLRLTFHVATMSFISNTMTYKYRSSVDHESCADHTRAFGLLWFLFTIQRRKETEIASTIFARVVWSTYLKFNEISLLSFVSSTEYSYFYSQPYQQSRTTGCLAQLALSA